MSLEEKKRVALGLATLVPNDDSHLVLSTGSGRGPFDEEHDGAELFWRGDGDTRTPAQVFQQGFKADYLLNNDPDAGKIVWRAIQDDVVHDSGVCLARDLRGAAFFPFTDGQGRYHSDSVYLYAVAPKWTANTYRAQQIAEAVETGKMEGRFPPRKSGFWRTMKERWKYDPEEEDDEGSSCVWQFQEHVTLEVEPSEIVGCWEMSRTMMVEPRVDERQKAGIRFSVGRKLRENKGHDLLDQARSVVAGYERSYPKKNGNWLSFRGIIECSKTVNDLKDAKLLSKQLEAIVVHEGKVSARGEH